MNDFDFLVDKVGTPDFDAVRDKRLSELTPEQRRDALELWIREQVPAVGKEHIPFLLERLDEARSTAMALIREMLDSDRAYAEAGLSDKAAGQRMLEAFRAARRYIAAGEPARYGSIAERAEAGKEAGLWADGEKQDTCTKPSACGGERP